MSFIPIIEKYIKENDRVYRYFIDDVRTLSPEQLKEATEQSVYCVVEDIATSGIITKNALNGDSDYLSIFDIAFHSVIYNENGELFDRDAFMKEFTDLYPNVFLLTPQRIKERIKEGYKYMFHPAGVNEIPVDERKAELASFTVSIVDDMGLAGSGGFLDLSDAIFDCLYYDLEGNLVDTSDLREDLLKRWDEKSTS